MFRKSFKPLFLTLFVLVTASFAFGQFDDTPPKEDIPTGIKETLAKQRIKQNEKDFEELISRSEEVAKLSEELSKSVENSKKLSSEDTKKLQKLEKMVKKIRQELGASEDKEDSSRQNTIRNYRQY